LAGLALLLVGVFLGFQLATLSLLSDDLGTNNNNNNNNLYTHSMLNHATVFMQRALTVTSEEEEEAAGRSGVLQQHHPEQLQLQPLHQLQDQHLQQQDTQVWKQEDYVTVHENLLDKPSQEPGVCLFGSKIYLMGGYVTMRHEHLDNPGDTGLGTDRFTIYDMADSSVVEGPRCPSGPTISAVRSVPLARCT
jgi:hypothetical protein